METTLTKWMAVWTLVVIAGAGVATAEVKVDRMFSDHMVLQRGMPVPVWGTAGIGEKVTVAFGGQSKQTEADTEGKWLVRLDALKVGKPAR